MLAAPMLEPAIRIATPADAALLAELGARTFRDTFAADNRPEDMAAYLASHYSPALQARERTGRGGDTRATIRCSSVTQPNATKNTIHPENV